MAPVRLLKANARSLCNRTSAGFARSCQPRRFPERPARLRLHRAPERGDDRIIGALPTLRTSSRSGSVQSCLR